MKSQEMLSRLNISQYLPHLPQIIDVSAFIYGEKCELGTDEPYETFFNTKVLYSNNVATLEKIIDIQNSVNALELSLEGVQGSIDSIPPPPPPPPPPIQEDPPSNSVAFRGCNGRDDDFDGS